jgi:hypothetical protein
MIRVLAETTTGNVYDLLNNILNVLQTIALAYLAADRHSVNVLRKAGTGTRTSDRVP